MALAIVVLFATGARAAEAAPARLMFCDTRDEHLEQADAAPLTFQRDLVRVFAARLRVLAELRWIDPREGGIERAVAGGSCDVALNVLATPGLLADHRVHPGLVQTVPYYAAGYVLVRRRDTPPLARLLERRDVRIAVGKESVAVYTLKHRGHPVYVVDDYKTVVNAVAGGRVLYGYVWAPVAAAVLRDVGDPIIAPEFVPDERWSFALAVRTEDAALHDALNAAIRGMLEDGALRQVFRTHGIPYLPPQPRPR